MTLLTNNLFLTSILNNKCIAILAVFVHISHLKNTDFPLRILTSKAVPEMFAHEKVIEVRYKILTL